MPWQINLFFKKITMKIITPLIYLFACPLVISAQTETVKVTGIIYYSTSHLYDTIENKTFTETSVLYFGNNQSLFRSLDYLQGMESAKKKALAGQSDMGLVTTKGSSEKYYTNLITKKITRVQTNGMVSVYVSPKQYVMPEPMEKTAWTITKETRKIGDYLCQKAMGMCRGRYYTAWFAPDIPYSFGPWKLNGLPGLILEAEDKRNHVIFRFNRIEFPLDRTETIEPVTNTILTTEVEFERMRETPPPSTPPPAGVTVLSSGLVDAQGKPVVKQKRRNDFNNPMDLISRLPRLFMQ
jgi:GLPGLI family protein